MRYSRPTPASSECMTPTTAASAAARSRRRALTTLFSALGVDASAAPSMRRPGQAPTDTTLANLNGAAASVATSSGPPSAMAWLNRATFGCTPADLAAFNALPADGASRWTAWVDRQLNLLDDDSACN